MDNKQCSIPRHSGNGLHHPDLVLSRQEALCQSPSRPCGLYINNQYIETMQWKTLNNPRNPDQPDTLFLSNTIPAEGDRIKIVASTPEYGTVTAEDIIPKKVPIKNASHTIKKR